MRKIFGGAMLFSALGAAILGGALAWEATEISDINTVGVGSISFGIAYAQNGGAQLGPDDGINNEVGTGLIQNLGNLNIEFKEGGVEILDVTGPAGGTAQCNTSNFGGIVNYLGQQGGTGLATGDIAAFDVGMNVAPGAPDACQGAVVSYVVFVTMQTTPAN
jgi:hypothetical protein